MGKCNQLTTLPFKGLKLLAVHKVQSLSHLWVTLYLRNAGMAHNVNRSSQFYLCIMQLSTTDKHTRVCPDIIQLVLTYQPKSTRHDRNMLELNQHMVTE